MPSLVPIWQVPYLEILNEHYYTVLAKMIVEYIPDAEYYTSSDGERKIRGIRVRNKKEGRWTLQRDDRKVAEGVYINGKREGIWIFWRTNGTQKQGPYLRGKTNGKWTVTYSNGRRASEGNLVNGRKEGMWKCWGINGEFDGEIQYKNGKMVDTTIESIKHLIEK